MLVDYIQLAKSPTRVLIWGVRNFTLELGTNTLNVATFMLELYQIPCPSLSKGIFILVEEQSLYGGKPL